MKRQTHKNDIFSLILTGYQLNRTNLIIMSDWVIYNLEDFSFIYSSIWLIIILIWYYVPYVTILCFFFTCIQWIFTYSDAMLCNEYYSYHHYTFALYFHIVWQWNILVHCLISDITSVRFVKLIIPCHAWLIFFLLCFVMCTCHAIERNQKWSNHSIIMFDNHFDNFFQ